MARPFFFQPALLAPQAALRPPAPGAGCHSTSLPSREIFSETGIESGGSGTGRRGLAYTGCLPCSRYHSATVAFLCMFSTICRHPTPVLYAQKEISPACVAYG